MHAPQPPGLVSCISTRTRQKSRFSLLCHGREDSMDISQRVGCIYIAKRLSAKTALSITNKTHLNNSSASSLFVDPPGSPAATTLTAKASSLSSCPLPPFKTSSKSLRASLTSPFSKRARPRATSKWELVRAGLPSCSV